MTAVTISLPGVPFQNLPAVNTIAALRLRASIGLTQGENVQVNGGDALADGGGGLYTWDAASVLDDDGASVIKPSDRLGSAAGRWRIAIGAGGGGGGAGAKAATIAELKAATVESSPVTLTEEGLKGPFYFTLGDFTGQADNINIVKQDNTPLTEGAWVRQLAQAIAFKSPAAPNPRTRPADEKIGEIVTITDFAVADADVAAGVVSGTDVSAAFQALINNLDVRKIVVPQNARVRIDAALTLRNNLEIELQQGAELVGNVEDDFVLKGFGYQTAVPGPVTRAINRYDVDIELTGAASKVAPGEHLLVTFVVKDGGGNVTGYNNQVGVVQRAVDNYIFMELPLNYPMTPAANIIVAKLTGCRNVKITGTGRISNWATGGGGIRFNGARDIFIGGIEVKDTKYIGVSIEATYNSVVDGLLVDNNGATGLGYRASSYGLINRFVGEKPHADEALTLYHGCSHFKIVSPRIVQFPAGGDPTGGNAGNNILIDLVCSYIDIISPMCVGSATYSVFFSQSCEYCSVTDYQISRVDLAGIRVDPSCNHITIGSGNITDVLQTSDPYTGGNTAAVVISGGTGNAVVGNVRYSRIAGGRGVVNVPATANRGTFYTGRGGVDTNNPYLGWEVRGTNMGVVTGDFVQGTTGTTLTMTLSGTSGNVTGQIFSGQNGDSAVGKLQFQPFGGSLLIGLDALQVFADNTAAAALAPGTMYRTTTGGLQIKF